MSPDVASALAVDSDTGPDLAWDRLRTPAEHVRQRVFLTAEWRHLILLQYAVDPSILRPLVPAGNELDTLHGQTLVSLVAFRFRQTRLLGVPVPLHTDFPEVNLRFYVKRFDPTGMLQRGVVFVREIVPKPAITAVARMLYGENYATFPMDCRTTALPDVPETPASAEYHWGPRTGSERHCAHLHASASGPAEPILPGSDAWWTTQHFHGFARRRDGGTTHYQVAHPAWRCWPIERAEFTGNVAKLYGPEWQHLLEQTPVSAYFAEGSRIAVLNGTRLTMP